MIKMNNTIKDFYNGYCYPNPSKYICKPEAKFKHGSGTIGTGHIGKNILVVGCGSVLAVMAANTNPQSYVVGLDISETQIAISKSTKRKYKIKNVQHHVADICTIGSHTKFDIIDATGVLHHIEDLYLALDNIVSLMNSNGTFVGMVYSDKRPREIRHRVDFFRKMEFTPKDVRLWMCNREHSQAVLSWFNGYENSDQEIADTWLNPYFKEYSEIKWKEILNSVGFDKVHIEYNNLGTNLLFKASR